MERDVYSKKTLEFKLKTVSNFKATANFFNFLSFKKRTSLLIFYFSYSTQKHDDSIKTYFPFSKRQFPKKSNAEFT